MVIGCQGVKVLLNIDQDLKNRMQEPGRDGKVLRDHRSDGNVAVP